MISVEAVDGEAGRSLLPQGVDEDEGVKAELGVDKVGGREVAKVDVQELVIVEEVGAIDREELVIVGAVEAIDRRQASKDGVGMALMKFLSISNSPAPGLARRGG